MNTGLKKARLNAKKVLHYVVSEIENRPFLLNTNYKEGLEMNKYGAKKVKIDGIVFDSKREAVRYNQLKLLEKAGKIKGLELQWPFELIPAQYEVTDERYTKGRNKGQFKTKLVERAVIYKADFYYYDNEKNQFVVEDTKGFKTKDYVLKRKLLLYRYGIKITEI